MLAVSVDDVVDEKYPAILQGRDILENFFRWAETITAARSPAHRAKVAIEWTTPARLHRAGEQIHLLFEEIPARYAVAFHVEQGSTITWLQLSTLKILEQFTPDGLSLTDDHRIGMRLRLVRADGYMHPAENDLLAPPAKFVRDAVRHRRHVGHAGNPDQIGVAVEVDGLYALVDNAHLDIRWRDGRDDGQI